MESFLIYLLKSSGIVALFLLFYILFLKRETFFRSNRLYLLLGLGLSLLLPFIVITRTILVEPLPIFQEGLSDEIMIPISVENPLDWASFLIYIYGAGILFFTFRFVLQLFSLKKLIGKGKAIRDGAFIQVETNQKNAPFSFFNYLVYNPALHSLEELDTILIHEKVHAQERHSIDILLMHLFTIFQWYNPFIWLYRKYLDDNLEYLADARTISQNADKTKYQQLLLRTGMGENSYSVSTPFFNSSIKKRIIMINKNRSTRKNSLKYALIAPLLAGFIFLFNINTKAQVKSTDSKVDKENKYGPVVYDKNHNLDFNEFLINSNPPYGKLESTKNMQPSFFVRDSVRLYIVDGKKISKTEYEQIDPDTIDSVNVLKGEWAIEKYGDEAKNGVIEITLKTAYSKNPKINNKDSLKTEVSSLILHDSIDGRPFIVGESEGGVSLDIGNDDPIIMLDGKEIPQTVFEKIKPEDIKSINVWKSPKAIEKYGDKGKNGVVEVLLKDS